MECISFFICGELIDCKSYITIIFKLNIHLLSFIQFFEEFIHSNFNWNVKEVEKSLSSFLSQI